MIVGNVNRDLEAVVEVAIQDDKGELHSFHCVLDTGFDGFVALPAQVVQRLELVQSEVRRTLLLDAVEVFLPLYWGTVYWCEEFAEVPILGTKQEFLVGTAMLEDSTLTVQVWDGGEVLIEERPSRILSPPVVPTPSAFETLRQRRPSRPDAPPGSPSSAIWRLGQGSRTPYRPVPVSPFPRRTAVHCSQRGR